MFCIKKKETGLSLIEVLISIAIMALIFAIVMGFIITGFKSTKFNEEQEVATQQARDAMSKMVKYIRGANKSERGDYPLAQIKGDELVFYSDVDNNDKMEMIKFHFNPSELKLYETTIEPGINNNYSGAGTTTVIAQYVNNNDEPIFHYFDNGYNNTNLINKVRLIQIYLKINVTPSRAPADYILETDVNLRNLKDNL